MWIIDVSIFIEGPIRTEEITVGSPILSANRHIHIL
jgi:hypothetical protein